MNKEGIARQIGEKFSSLHYELSLHYTETAHHASALAKEAVRNRAEIVVAVGGDGSVNEISQALIGSETLLAIIPTGSGNGLARYLNIPLDRGAAIETIQKGKVETIDTICVNDRFYLGFAGIGFDAEVAWAFSEFGYRGFLSYLLLTLNKFPLYQPITYQLIIDGIHITREAFLICFANSSQFGNGAFIAPTAKIDDGYVDVVILKKFPFSAATRLATQLFNRTLHLSKYVEIIKCKEILINQPHLKAHIDGEPVFFPNGLRLQVVPSSLKILVP